MIQNYTMRVSDIHTHFIVDEHIFKSQEWKSAISEEYYPSIEHEAYYFSMSDHVNHERLENSKNSIIEPFRNLINSKMEQGLAFAIYKKFDESVRVVAFLPINIIEGDRIVAYLVSYTDAPVIAALLHTNRNNIMTLVFVLVIVFIGVYQSLRYRDQLKYELQHDLLTEISNRKYFLETAQAEYDKSSRLGHDFCIVMADIDFFKKVNDTYGHQCGDAVLKESAQLMEKSIRIYDMIGRYGGEEFILLMMTNELNARGTLDAIRQKVEAYDFTCNQTDIHVTISFGVAQYHNDDNLKALIKRADDALYKAKENGRNRIETA
jgi:diguanylate cyclase (GGDEF)-like protein